MKSMNGQVDGIAIAKYRKGKFTLTCKKSNGFYWDPDTNKKQYEFLYYDKDGTLKSSLIVDYKGFREIIDQYDWPRK